MKFWTATVQERVAVACALAMIGGLFFSRALLSVSMIVMLANALRPPTVGAYFQTWYRSVFSMACLGFFFVYLISGLWSANKSFWWAEVVNKVPFAILPFAFLSVPLKKPGYRYILFNGIVAMQLSVIAYSLLQLGMNPDYYLEGYEHSHPLPTTKYGDHIRFSISLVISILLMCFTLFDGDKGKPGAVQKFFFICSMVLFVVYIHILAAKTGLLSLYVAAMMYGGYRLGRKSKLMGGILIMAVAALPVVAYWAVPTFKAKMDYVRLEIDKTMHDQHFDYRFSDAGRMISYALGTKLIAQNKWKGVGAGDLMDEMNGAYDSFYPEVIKRERYGPINQFMFTALCVGIPLSLILIPLALSPMFMRVRKSEYLKVTAMVMLASMMVESMFEIQFGVFTFLFFTCLWVNLLGKNEGQTCFEQF
ncbi:MAG: hypothetical protein QM642_03950 [Edaphocola sp.]